LDRLSYAALFGLFMLYSVLIGFSLSTIFITYTETSIFAIFGISAATFGVMAIMCYVTSADLTKFGSILMMAFWGIMIASLINFFLESEGFQYLISIIGVLVFTGLTAYHMQQLKHLAHNSSIDEEHKNKLALIGGFTLYILFVNLFVSLLRLFGSRD
jgi:FtsH-binding integral membrane protein